jgi:hypothetical protein
MLTQAEIAAIQGTDIYDDCLEHSGVKGMHWYERRYQYPDGRLTPLGKLHYGIGQRREAKKTRIMQSGSAKKVLKYQKHLTDEEFEQAMARVGRSEALKKVANAPKEAKKAEKAAKEAAKQAEKIQEDKVKLSEKQFKNAKDIAKAQAKTKVQKDRSPGSLLAKGAAAAVAIAGAYKKYQDVAKMISDLTGTNLPGVNKTTISDWLGGKKGDKSGNDKKSTNASAQNVKTFTYNYDKASWDTISKKNEAKSETRKTNKTVWEMPAATDKYVRSGSDIVDDFLSGSVKETGTHFKDTKTSSFSDNTLAIGMNTVANILALPYDPDKKF